MDPPAALVLRRTRSALGGRKRTGDDEPRGRPAKGICLSSDVCTLMTIEAVCAEQGRRTFHYPDGHPLGLHSCRVVLLAPPLHAPLTLKLTRVSTFQTLHVFYIPAPAAGGALARHPLRARSGSYAGAHGPPPMSPGPLTSITITLARCSRSGHALAAHCRPLARLRQKHIPGTAARDRRSTTASCTAAAPRSVLGQ